MLFSHVKNMIFIYVKRFFSVALFTFIMLPAVSSADEIRIGTYANSPTTNTNWAISSPIFRIDTDIIGFDFTTPTDASVNFVEVPLSKAAACTGNIWLEIRENIQDGVYQGDVVATSNTITCNDITASENTTGSNFNTLKKTFTFPANILIASTSYSIIYTGSINPNYGSMLQVPGFSTQKFWAYDPAGSLSKTYTNSTGLQMVIDYDIYVPPPLFADFNFLGSTTPGDIMLSVTGGVQNTGGATWPLLTFVGVPAAFGIGRFVFALITKMV